MKKKIKYTDEPMNLRVIDDFLPRPEELVRKNENVRVTINLNKSSVEYFKQLAKEHNTQYQKVIRTLLDHYATKVA